MNEAKTESSLGASRSPIGYAKNASSAATFTRTSTAKDYVFPAAVLEGHQGDKDVVEALTLRIGGDAI